MLSNFIAPIAIGLIFVVWPIIGKTLRVDGGWMVAVVMGVTTLTIAFFSELQMAEAPKKSVIVGLVLLGILNGLAMISYGERTTDRTVDASTIIFGVSIVMVVTTPFLDYIFNKAPLSRADFLALFLALAAIYVKSGSR